VGTCFFFTVPVGAGVGEEIETTATNAR